MTGDLAVLNDIPYALRMERAPMEVKDYYEFLQISPNAEFSTIQRVYRYLAARLHPDNPETGNTEQFVTLRRVYDVLSDPDRRAQYDATYRKEVSAEAPLSSSIDFMDNIEGELNRRLAVLALLYIQRRTSPYYPEVSLAEIEYRMGFPRDYLHFTMWYLRSKSYVTMADNADFTLTVDGVDFVEANRVNIPILNKLLSEHTQVPQKGGGVTKALPVASIPLAASGGNGGSGR